MTERPLHCTIKNPVLLSIPDVKSDFHSGCRIIDISLSNIINPERRDLRSAKSNKIKIEEIDKRRDLRSAKSNKIKIEEIDKVGEIHFKNNYTAYLTVKAKCRMPDSKDGNEIKWRTCVKRMRLMPSPHVEAGAQDYFILTRKQMQFELVNVSALRLILQQPSPVWKDFKIDDLKVFRGSESGKTNPLPAWLTEDSGRSVGKRKIELTEEDMFPPQVVQKDKDIMGIADLESVSTNLQQLWALSEEVAAQQTSKALGRYEVDGCYEINLLSYT